MDEGEYLHQHYVSFTVGKGFLQQDPLAPFLFLIAAEGLTGLTRKAVEIGPLKGFKVMWNLTLTFCNMPMTPF
jgi:hypothetical protein